MVFTVLLLLSAAVFQLRAEQTRIDRKQVEELIAKAEAGDADSENRLGSCYETGDGVAIDHIEALKWYRKAAEQGFAPAQANLGSYYFIGDVVARDLSEAVKWYRKAAEQNDATAQYQLGACYAMGWGVARADCGGTKAGPQFQAP